MTITKEGNLASFYTVNKAPIKHLKVYFSPKQAGEGDPSPENVREISGWNDIKIWHAGKNIFLSDWELGGIKASTGLNENKTYTVRTASYIPVVPGQHYAITRSILYLSNWQIRGYDDNQNFINSGADSYTLISGSGTANPLTNSRDNCIISPKEGVRYWRFTNYNVDQTIAGQINWAMIVPGDTPDYNYEPYTYQLLPLDWSSEVGTVYGGYVDLVTGKLVQTHSYITAGVTNIFSNLTITSLSLINNNEDIRFWVGIAETNGNPARKDNTVPICNMLKSNSAIGYTSYSDGKNICGAANTYPQSFWCIMPTSIVGTTAESICNYLNTNHFMFCSEMKTPITHQLTPTQLSTLIGRNNIWSNADHVEVEYDLAESNDELYRRRNIILKSAPHIETVSGSMAHFETDIVAPIKSAEISFSPVQEGSGDPSPENVRAISGWSGIELTHCQDNLFDMNSLQISNGTYSISVENGVAIGSGTAFYTLMIQNKNIIKKPFIALKGYSYTFKITAYTDGNVSAANENGLAFVVFYSDGTNYVRARWRNNETTPSTKTYTVNADSEITGIAFSYSNAGSNIWHITNVQVEIEENTSTKLYNGATTILDWASVAGTIYGGYIDILSGELVKTHGLCIMDGVTSQKMFTAKGGVSSSNPWSNNYYFQFEAAALLDRAVGWIPADVLTNNGIFSNYFPNHDGNGIIITDISFGAYIGSSGTRFQPRIMWPYSTTDFDTVEKANNWLKEQYDNGTPFSFSYKLKNPIHYQLSPQTLRTLCGVNNIWSNANGPIEVSYWTH